jgi:mono/diheme cytochrome c family protein
MRYGLLLLLVLTTCAACARQDPQPPPPIGDAERGKAAIAQASCGVCHRIPGIEGAEGTMALPLHDVAARPQLAGGLPNTPENVVRWIVNPQDIKPGSDMPDMDIEEPVARDMAAYLLSLK